MMIQRKETFNTTVIQYSPNWIKSKFVAEWKQVKAAEISDFYLNIYSCC